MTNCRNFDYDGSCTNCIYCDDYKKCLYLPKLIDANVILSEPLQELGLERFQVIKNNHRRKYRLAVNHLILGEIFRKLSNEKIAANSILDWLEKNFDFINKLEVLEVPTFHEDFHKILSLLKDCYCGERDKIIATCAIIQGVELATFDEKLIGDVKTINKKLSQHKELKDKGYFLKILEF